MKLANFTTADSGQRKAGVIINDSVIDLGDVGIEGTLDDLILQGLDIAAINSALENGEPQPLSQVSLQSPVARPGKILAIGLNYRDHIDESGMDAPRHQVWFNKQHNCVNGPFGNINLPVASNQLDYEAELCLIIGKRCKHVSTERAHEVIAGYCCGNDVSVRDWQLRAQTFQIGKSFDTHGPIGPYLVTPDEVGDPHNLDIRCTVNGEQRQHSNTKHLIFDCYDAIAHLTQAFTLDPGDVLFMGTPAGVGMAMKPASWLKAGDKVRVDIEKLGYIENTVVEEDATTILE